MVEAPDAKTIKAFTEEQELTADLHHIDDLLQSWHRWGQNVPVRGWQSRDPVCGEYRTSRQYDDTNGALDADLDKLTMRTVESVIRLIEQPHQTAICVHARNLCTGYSVWTSPRLPQDHGTRVQLLASALHILRRKLKSAGVL